MAKKSKQKAAAKKASPKKSAKKPKVKKPSSGISFGQRMKSAFSFSKSRGDGTPNDDLYLDMLDSGLLDEGNQGNPVHPDVAEAEAEIPFEMSEAAAQQWPEARLNIVQDIWGKDFLKPGGAADVIDLVRPLALNSDHTVLDIGAGLGGSSRTIANETGAWVSGFEANADLAEAAMQLSKMAGMTRKAPVAALPPEGPNMKPKSVNAMFSKEALYKIEDKETLFSSIDTILRPHGQIMLTDYVAAQENMDSPELQVWSAQERTPAHLWTTDSYRSYFEGNGYDVRVAEDITDKYYSKVVNGFSLFSNTIKTFRGNKEMEEWSIREAEFWVRRMAPFEAGDLRVCRVFAQKGA